jgi:hypothetical protein
VDIRPDTIGDRHTEFLMYVDFVEYYVSAVIGLRHFEKHKCNKQYRKYVTVSDEAFAILTLENNWDRWMAMAIADLWKTSPVPTKWTVTKDKSTIAAPREGDAATQKCEAEARRFRGWSAKGILRYNQLFDQIKKERTTPRAERFEDKLMQHFQHKNVGGKGKNKKSKVTPPPLPTPKHELWSDDTIITANHTTELADGNTDENNITEIDSNPAGLSDDLESIVEHPI